MSPEGECEFTLHYNGGSFRTACGNEYLFSSMSNKGAKYCPFCGRVLKQGDNDNDRR